MLESDKLMKNFHYTTGLLKILFERMNFCRDGFSIFDFTEICYVASEPACTAILTPLMYSIPEKMMNIRGMNKKKIFGNIG